VSWREDMAPESARMIVPENVRCESEGSLLFLEYPPNQTRMPPEFPCLTPARVSEAPLKR